VPSPGELTAVVRLVGPDLKNLGFRKFGMTFNREPEDGLIHVVNFQGSKWGDKFTVNVGIYVREVDELLDDWWRRERKSGVPGRDGAVFESVCWLRERIGRFDSDGHDQWWGYGKPETSAREIRSKLLTRVEPVLSQQASRTGLIALWDAARGGDLGWRKEPRTPLGFALLLKQIGRDVDAGAIVQQLCEDSKGVPFHATVQVLAEDLGVPCAHDPDHPPHP
jgi:uncharacterized protein DUF4304